MQHPLQRIPQEKRVPVLLSLLVLTIGLGTVISWTLWSENYDIVDLELACTEQKAHEIIDSWDAIARERALLNVGLDYPYLVAYSTTIGLCCTLASGQFRSRRWPGATVGLILAWGQWLAALFDAVENVALLQMLNGAIHNPWPQISLWCAIPKFLLIAGGLTYTLAGVLVWLVTRLCRSQNE